MQMLKDEYSRAPMQILSILSKRKIDGYSGYEEILPSITQIRGLKRRMIPNNDGLKYKQVVELLTKISADLIDRNDEDTKVFSYGLKLGDGTDSDPFAACFSTKNLLLNMSKFPGHHAVFHIDGTYKLIKNRFPVLVYGRSDVNGQFHLISIAIVSHENQELFSHFFK